MHLKVTKSDHSFDVHVAERPDSPALGKGSNISEALGNFMLQYQSQVGITIEADASAQHAELTRPDRDRKKGE